MSGRKLSAMLRAMKACEEAVEWAKPYATLAEGWEVCERADWMCWYLDAVGGYGKTLRTLAFEWADRAVRVHAVAALESAADALERESVDATAVRDHIGRLRALEPIRSSNAALAVSNAAWAVSNAAWAASNAAGAVSNAAWAASNAAGAVSNAALAVSNAAGAASNAALAGEQRMMCDRIRAVVPEPRTPNLAEVA